MLFALVCLFRVNKYLNFIFEKRKIETSRQQPCRQIAPNAKLQTSWSRFFVFVSNHCMREDDIKKSLEAEEEFRKFLDKINVPYLPISNEMGKFSTVLKAVLNSKRPDYLLLLGKAGMLPVDVKYRDGERGYNNDFTLNCDEVERYLNFSNAFGTDVWYAISNRQMNFATWYWLSVNDVKEKKFEKRKNTETGEKFYVAPKKELIKVLVEGERPLAEIIHTLTLPHS